MEGKTPRWVVLGNMVADNYDHLDSRVTAERVWITAGILSAACVLVAAGAAWHLAVLRAAGGLLTLGFFLAPVFLPLVHRRNEECPVSGNPCPDCGHPFDPHILVCYEAGNPMRGGLMFCQELDTCECVHTWGPSAGGRDFNPDARTMPPPHVVAEWREALRGEAGN